MKLIEASVRHPHSVIVGVVLCALFGYLSMMAIPMQMKPTLDKPEITINTTYRGASPAETEDQLTTPIEDEMDAVEGVRKVKSTSAEGRSSITLEFDWGVDKDTALIDVINKLNQVPDLPDEADEPTVRAVTSDEQQPVMWFVSRSSKSPNELFEIAEDVLEPRIRRIEGVGDLRIFGGEEREVHVLVDPWAMASRGITFGQLIEALRRENLNVRGGFIDEDKRRYTVRTMGQFSDVDDIGEVIVARTPAGAVYLKELATARFGYKKQLSTVRTNGQPTVVFGVVRKSGANVVAVCRRVQAAIDDVNEEFEQKGVDLRLEVVHTEVDYIEEAIQLVRENLLIGGLLATGVLLVFLRSMKSAAVAAASIPVTMITVFILLQAFGRTINIISLAGLAFAVGMVVDNAIVVLENIYRHLEMGKRTAEAIAAAAAEVWGAVLASTLTTLAVFLPIVFIQEEAGQLFKDIAIAISCAIGLSLLVSLTVVPMLSRLVLLPGAGPAQGRPGAGWRRVVDVLLLGWVGRAAAGAYAWAMGHMVGASPARIAAKVLVVAMLAAGFCLSLRLLPEAEYLPSGNQNFLLVFASPLVGSHLDKRVESVRPLEQKLLNDPRVERFFCVFGSRFNAVGARLHKRYADERTLQAYLDELRAFTSTMTGFKSLFAMQASMFRDPGKQFDVEISGPDLARIESLSHEIEAQLRAMDGVMFVRTNYQPNRPEVQVRLDRERCAALELRVSDVSTAIESLVAGKVVGTFSDRGKEIDLTLRAKPGLVETRNALAAVPIVTAAGRQVRLDSIAAVRTTTGPVEIRHLEKQRAIILTVNLHRHVSLERAIKRVDTEIFRPLRARIPATYTLKLGGAADKLNSTLRALKGSFVLALIIIYLLMVALFESFTYPLIIMATVPLAASGAFMGITVANWLSEGRVIFDVITMLGLVILSGIVVNNAILIVHQALNFRREGLSPDRALLESCRTRLRPIFMSAATSIFGMLPLAIGRGSGAELYRGLGAALVGGLAVSTIFTLFLVPCLLSLVQDMQGGLRRALAAASERDQDPDGS